MKKFSLTAIARHRLEHARNASSGRSAEMVYGGHEHVLRQTVIALVARQEMAEHRGHGEATVYVLDGRIRLVTGDDQWEGIAGDLLILPPSHRHRLEALTDSAILLTVARL